MSNWQPGPPPPGAGTPQPPPGRPRRVIWLVAGSIAALLLIAVAVTFSIGLIWTDHTLSTPSSAGGFSRDVATEVKAGVQIEKQRDIIEQASDFGIADFKSAVYGDGDMRYLFVGGTGSFDPDELEEKYESALDLQGIEERYLVTVTSILDAGGDGAGACALLSAKGAGSTPYTSLCAWATRTSFATITPLPHLDDPIPAIAVPPSVAGPPKYEVTKVEGHLRRIRGDVED